MIITNEWLKEHSTYNGGYTAKQLHVINISWPPRHGWKNQVVGQDISRQNQLEFENESLRSYIKAFEKQKKSF
jgi:hypothetical protein